MLRLHVTLEAFGYWREFALFELSEPLCLSIMLAIWETGLADAACVLH